MSFGVIHQRGDDLSQLFGGTPFDPLDLKHVLSHAVGITVRPFGLGQECLHLGDETGLVAGWPDAALVRETGTTFLEMFDDGPPAMLIQIGGRPDTCNCPQHVPVDVICHAELFLGQVDLGQVGAAGII